MGDAETAACRYFFYDTLGRKQSPWHHIPLFKPQEGEEALALSGSNIVHFVNEIPRGCVSIQASS